MKSTRRWPPSSYRHNWPDVRPRTSDRPRWTSSTPASSAQRGWRRNYCNWPDWNPVLGRLQALPGLMLAYGFSGHGFKLSPAVGRLLAQEALGLPTDLSLVPYAPERFSQGRPLTGLYGSGAVS